MKRKGFFDNFFREFEEMDDLFGNLYGGLTHSGIENIKEPLYYGFSIHVGPEGIPKMTHFGNISPELEGDTQSEIREPYSDVIVDEKTKETVVTLEMPGVEKKDINIETTEKSIDIKAHTEGRKYHKNVQLNQEINPNTMKAAYNNGVLEIKAKLKDPTKKGKRIKVE